MCRLAVRSKSIILSLPDKCCLLCTTCVHILANYRDGDFCWWHRNEVSDLPASGCGVRWSQTLTALSGYDGERCWRTPAARLLHRQAAEHWAQQLCRIVAIVWCCYEQTQMQSWRLMSAFMILHFVFFCPVLSSLPIVLTCTNGVSPNHLPAIVVSNRPWTTLSTRAH